MAVQTVIKMRRDTAANWTSTNPTLAAGESGLESDTGKIKVGNGSTAWASLGYSNPGGAIPQSQVTNLTTDLSAKQATVTGAATTILFSDLTTGRALTSNGTGKVSVSATTDTELGYLSGVTSAVQTQLNGKAATSHTHVLADITDVIITSPAANQVISYNGTTWVNTAAPEAGFNPFLLMGA